MNIVLNRLIEELSIAGIKDIEVLEGITESIK